MPAASPEVSIPVGLRLRHTLRDHKNAIGRIAWSPDGKILASPSDDRTIRLWDAETGEAIRVIKGASQLGFGIAWSPTGKHLASAGNEKALRVWNTQSDCKTEAAVLRGHNHPVICVAWSPDGQFLASGAMERPIRIWNAGTGKLVKVLTRHSDKVACLAWSHDGTTLASGSRDGSIILWDTDTFEPRQVFPAYPGWIVSVEWALDDHTLASAASGSTLIRIWDAYTGQERDRLEGHTASVHSLSYSSDGSLLASKSSDGTVRVWRCATWETVAILEESASDYWPPGLAFHPSNPSVLATLGQKDTVIRIWDLDLDILLGSRATSSTVHYTNAKIVLVGDTGVGKTCLSHALLGEPFKPQESTHGRRIWILDKSEIEYADRRRETREIWLWDLAGQPGYRLVHQLHLNEVAVALVVFDARSETDPFAGVYHWGRALRLAQHVGGRSTHLAKLLVAARTDRGGIAASPTRIAEVVHEMGFDGYFETSAKEGRGTTELSDAIRAAITWDTLPKVSSTAFFQCIKAFLLAEKETGHVLATIDDLYHAFLKAEPGQAGVPDLQAQFETCIGLVEVSGLIRWLSFGDLVLLQPELLDAYASALINAAREEPEGLGCMAEEDARAARFHMPGDERIKNRTQEMLLLIATIEDLLRHEIAVRQPADEGPYLVFPSQFTRKHPDLPDPPGKAVVFRFDGPLQSIYSTLAVRLSHSGVFAKRDMWKNAATYKGAVGGTCGIALREIEEGRGELALFFDSSASEETRFQFEQFIQMHLQRRALPDSIIRQRIYVCSGCTTPITDLQTARRRERGFDWIECNVCGQPISLRDREERLAATPSSAVFGMDQAADAGRDLAAAALVLQGKKHTKDYDVFISYSHRDEQWVHNWLIPQLEHRGIYPYVDQRDFEVGLSILDNIERAIERTHKTLMVLTPNYLHSEWATFESLLVQTQDPATLRQRVLPLMLEKCALPKRIAMLTYADFTDPAKREFEMERLVAAINRRGDLAQK